MGSRCSGEFEVAFEKDGKGYRVMELEYFCVGDLPSDLNFSSLSKGLGQGMREGEESVDVCERVVSVGRKDESAEGDKGGID